MKKGQVTIFLILSLVVLIAFGILFTYFSQINDAKSGQQQNRLTDENLVRNQFEQRMSSCLDNAAENALILLGQQGGFYYKDQLVPTEYGNFNLDGIELDSDFKITVSGKKHTVWIQKQNLERYQSSRDYGNERHYFSTPHYPCRSAVTGRFSKSNPKKDMPNCEVGYTIETFMDSFSKAINIPGFCDDKIPEGCTNYCECECFSNCDKTIQAQLEDYVGKYFDLCFENFTIPGYNKPDVDYKDKVQSSISLSTVQFYVNESMNFVSNTTGSVITLDTPTSKSIKLKLFGLFTGQVSSLFNDEFGLASHNLTYELKKLKYFSELKIDKRPVPANGKYYNLLVLTLDGADGNVKGMPYEFYIARENRPPVLEYIEDKSTRNQDINLEIRVADPDEDKLSIDFESNKLEEKVPFITTDPNDEFKRTLHFRAIDNDFSEEVKISVCDSPEGLCDFQYVTITKNP